MERRGPPNLIAERSEKRAKEEEEKEGERRRGGELNCKIPTEWKRHVISNDKVNALWSISDPEEHLKNVFQHLGCCTRTYRLSDGAGEVRLHYSWTEPTPSVDKATTAAAAVITSKLGKTCSEESLSKPGSTNNIANQAGVLLEEFRTLVRAL